MLSGGTGTRLRPLTFTGAKQLVPVANKPVLFYALEAIRDAGVADVGVVVGATGPAVRAAVGDGSCWGIRVTYVEQDAPRGLAHAVLVAREFLGDEPFVLFLGDNMVSDGVAEAVRRFAEEAPNALLLLGRVDDPRRYGVAELRGGRVVRLVEKPQVPLGDLALVGVYVLDAHVHEAVRAIAPSRRGELEITDAIQWLVDRGFTVEGHLVRGWWKDVGSPADVLEANRLALADVERRVEGEVDAASRLEGAVVVEAGARVAASVVRGPAAIGSGAIVEDSRVGPYAAIGPGAVVRRSRVADSVLMEGAVLADVPALVEGSLVGRGAVLGGSGAALGGGGAVPAGRHAVLGGRGTPGGGRGTPGGGWGSRRVLSVVLGDLSRVTLA